MTVRSEWHWRTTRQYASKPWQATKRVDGAIVGRRNFRTEELVREWARAIDRAAVRTDG